MDRFLDTFIPRLAERLPMERALSKQFDCMDKIRPRQEGFAALCESDTVDTRNGSAWDTVERIHVYHAADPSMDMDIKLDSLWATRQKYSATRQDVINRFVEDAEDFNKWLATSEDGDAFITSALIKFKGEPDAITVDIPCPVGADDLVSSGRSSLHESAGAPGSPEIPGSFQPTTGAQAKVDVKPKQQGIVVDKFLDTFLSRLAETLPDERVLIEAIAEGYRLCHPMLESASSTLYHFTSFDGLKGIVRRDRFIPSFAEQRHDGEGHGSVSFSRTGSIREGYPALMFTDDCAGGRGWCIVRIRVDGDAINRINRFRQGGRYHTAKVAPFDWAHHEFGDTIADNFEGLDDNARPDTGKTWMMSSSGAVHTSMPVGDDEYDGFVSDRKAHPYSQAEDRLTTTARFMPGARKLISGVDILLVPNNFSPENYPERIELRRMLSQNGFLSGKTRLYMSRRDFEMGHPAANGVRLLTAPGESHGGDYAMPEPVQY